MNVSKTKRKAKERKHNKIRSTSSTDPNVSMTSHNKKISISSIYKLSSLHFYSQSQHVSHTSTDNQVCIIVCR